MLAMRMLAMETRRSPAAGPGGMTRARALRLAGAALAGGALAACGTAGQGAAPQKPAQPVEVEYWSTLPETHPTGKGRIDALRLSEQANAEYFRVKYAEPGGANIEKMIASLAAGTPPNLVVDYPYFAARLHIKDGLIDYDKELKAQPAWARAKANLSPAFLEGIQWLGAMVGIPFQISQQAMVYAPDKLEKAGVRPPNGLTWTWTDFEEIAKRAAKPPDVWGLSVGWRSSGYTTWAASNGTSWLSKDGTKISFTHPEGMAGVELLTRLTNGLKLMPLGANQKSAGELIVKGQTVFEPNGPYRLPVWKQAGVTRVEGVPFPRGPHKPTTYNWGTLYSFIVFKSSDPAKQRASVQAALGALADDAQAAHAVSDYGLPVTKTGKEAPAYRQYVAQEPLMKQFADMFPSCQVDPAIPSQGEMRAIMDTTMLKIYDQQEGARNALLGAEREIQALHDADLKASKE
jgi:ABC-type glycerol-3-phosphate transport system substrate-binding protein